MPEVHFAVRWPDGSVQRCVSPSRAIEETLAPGATYPLDEFVRRARQGLEAAGERVRAKFGFACTAAAAQIDSLELAAGALDGSPAALVTVQSMRRAAGRGTTRPVNGTVGGHRPVVVIGGGQAGLAVSWCLTRRGVEHLVLERHRIAHAWREERWDSFCLVTPNWQCQLPGFPYPGDDPHGFMLRDEIVRYVEDYAAAFDPPLVEGVEVKAVRDAGDGRFAIETSAGALTAEQVVLAVGGYHVPAVPRIAEQLPDSVTQLHSSRYRNPHALPDGGVLVVGSGQSGAQIAEDLHLAGREVHLSVGTAPRVSRFYRGRDVVAWLHDMGHYDMPIEEHPEGLGARKEANHYVTGRGGGRDIDLRAHARDGMHLHGRVLDLGDGMARFADDLAANLDAADATNERIKAGIDRHIAAHGIAAPAEPRYEPPWHPAGDAPTTLDLEAAAISTVIWSTGFRSDWSWVQLPAFDDSGYPTHHRGVTPVPGLYVIGLPWLHTWGSGRFAGIARDAEHVAGHITAKLAPKDMVA